MREAWVCIDDETATTLRPYLAALEETSAGITLGRVALGDIGAMIDTLKATRAVGYLIDLRLDEIADEHGGKVAYRGLTLAQELRTRMTEGELQQLPLVLWSVDWKLSKSWYGDDTGHDLFDRVYVKDKDVVDNSEQTARELASLSKGYRRLADSVAQGIEGFWLALAASGDARQSLDPRITEGLALRERHIPHEWSHYTLKHLIDRPGPLIPEELLLARLGINRETSPDWKQLLQAEIGPACGYAGVFSDGWPRWWAYRLEEWWRNLAGSPGDLRTLRAGERVQTLRKTFPYKRLEAAKPIEDGYGDRFWTLCMGLRQPLDTGDGVVAMAADLRAWQDRPYLSMKAALERIGRPDWRPHPFEEARVRAAAAQH